MTCECCGGTFVDDVGLALVIEGMLEYRRELDAKLKADAEEWERAQATVEQFMAGQR